MRVKRDGRVEEVAAEELVPGDIVTIEAGMKVPADMRLIEVFKWNVLFWLPSIYKR